MINRISFHGTTSDALRKHATDRLTTALAAYEPSVTGVIVTLTDENGPKSGPADRRFHVVVSLRGGGDVVVDERGEDAYAVAATGADRVKLAVARKLEKKHDKHHGAAANQHHTGIAAGTSGVE